MTTIAASQFIAEHEPRCFTMSSNDELAQCLRFIRVGSPDGAFTTVSETPKREDGSNHDSAAWIRRTCWWLQFIGMATSSNVTKPGDIGKVTAWYLTSAGLAELQRLEHAGVRVAEDI